MPTLISSYNTIMPKARMVAIPCPQIGKWKPSKKQGTKRKPVKKAVRR
jgi:hypothetical protein